MPDYRYIAAHALTGDVLHGYLPLTGVECGPELNGPGSLSATLDPGLARPIYEYLDPGNTLLYVERDGRLVWGGIVWRAEPQGPVFPIEAAGFGSYPHRRHDLHGNLDGRGPYIEADPCQVIRDAWEYLQEQPDGDLNVTVDDTKSKATAGTSKTPYSLPKTEARNLGEVIDEMADIEDGLEWTESVTWSDRRASHRIHLGAPRLGRRREDITFTSGINIASAPQAIEDADEFAQAVVALGAGEGRKRPHAVDSVRDGRLRLEHRLETNEKSVAKLRSRARQQRLRRQVLTDLTELDVRDHPAAPFGAWNIGDDVLVRLREQHISYEGWHRITGWTLRPPNGSEAERITLNLERTAKPEDAEETEEP
ncbi:hypothetical protein H9Y04_35260 [Streptomyces sp. TRM66268-LWL]|uniref:Uncharacterized protein n=1 Tax=Streptomyces polyasparticus TaxID=2767826 RepID=A0ABR7SU50_9ACTN|nr:hypothetical protein [Streptomyces polyasparticus]MBC9717803.1 hypothetical protein [Streptomyces polyasparticus]